MSVEHKFSVLAQKTIEEAGRIPCSIAEYKDGLELIVEEIGVSIAAAEQDLKQEEKDND